MFVYTKIRKFYSSKITSLISYCTQLDKRKTALAISFAMCTGVTPLFGFTILIGLAIGYTFKLNHVIIQSIQLLISPLQIVFFYPFIRTGQYLFGIQNELSLPVKLIPGYIFNHTQEFFSLYFKIYISGIITWIAFSILSCFILFRVFLGVLSRS